MKRLASILTFLFGGVYIAALFNYTAIISSFTYNGMYDNKYGYDLIMELVDSFKNGFSFGVDTTLVPIMVAAGALFAAIVTIMGLIGIFTRNGGVKGAHVVAIITLIIDIAILIVVLAVNKSEATGYGLYIFLGLAVLMIIFGLIANANGGRRGGRREGPRGGGYGGGYNGPRGGGYGGGYGGPRGGGYGGGYGGPRGGYSGRRF